MLFSLSKVPLLAHCHTQFVPQASQPDWREAGCAAGAGPLLQSAQSASQRVARAARSQGKRRRPLFFITRRGSPNRRSYVDTAPKEARCRGRRGFDAPRRGGLLPRLSGSMSSHAGLDFLSGLVQEAAQRQARSPSSVPRGYSCLAQLLGCAVDGTAREWQSVQKPEANFPTIIAQ